MIARIWHGYTSKENSKVYENLLINEIFPEIEEKIIKGYRGAQILKREMDHETEFTSIIWFEDLDSVKSFVGEQIETVYVPEKARKVLTRFDETAAHHELMLDLT